MRAEHDMIKKSSFTFLVLFFASAISFASIPVIHSFVGKPLIQLVDGDVKVVPVKGKKIEQSFSIKTNAGEQLKLELGKNFYLVVFPESSAKVEAYYISKTVFKIKSVIFNSGRFYIKNESTFDEDLEVIYQSDFFIWRSTPKNNQREFFVEVKPEAAQVRFCAGEKGLTATLFDHEIVKVLKYQEGASFQGLLKEGELEFDLLLEGRKIPKGEWKESFTCEFAQILKEISSFEGKEKAKTQKTKDQHKAASKKQKLEYEKSLCHSPNGQFNDCFWKREESSCFRYRCDGEGQWKERTQLPKNQYYQCETKSKVARCDY